MLKTDTQAVVLSVCKCVKVCCCGPCTGIIRQHCGVAKLQLVMVCQLLHHKLVAWTAAVFCLALFFFVCLSDYFCTLVLIPEFILLLYCLFLRPESSGDSAAFLSTSRSFSSYTLLAAAVWSKRSAAIGQQTGPHPLHHCSPPRTRTPPRAPHKVSTCNHSQRLFLIGQQ